MVHLHTKNGDVQRDVLAILQQTRGTWTLMWLSSKTGYSRDAVARVVMHLQAAGFVDVVGEQREKRQRGRGRRIYRFHALPTGPRVEAVREAVAALSEYQRFRSTYIAKVLGQTTTRAATEIDLILEGLEREGVVHRMVEISADQMHIRGVRPKMWTSNPTMIARQREFARRIAEAKRLRRI